MSDAKQTTPDLSFVADVKEAIRETEYKYFGDYEFSDGQHKAVGTLVAVACLWLRQQGHPYREEDKRYAQRTFA